MKRSHSLAQTQKTPTFKRSLTWEEKVGGFNGYSNTYQLSAVPGTSKSNKTVKDFLVSPISLTSYGRKPNSKILTSDFWSNGMKLKLRKKTEGFGLCMISEKLIPNTQKFDELRPLMRKNFGTSLENINKLTGMQKVGFLDKIINQCKNETADTRKLRHEFFHLRKEVSCSLIKEVKL